MLYSEIISLASLFTLVIGLGLVIFNFLNNKGLGYIGLSMLTSAVILSMAAGTFHSRYDFCIDKGYQGQGKDAEQVVYFCYKIENGTKITYYYDEYEIKDREKQQLNKEEKNNEHTK